MNTVSTPWPSRVLLSYEGSQFGGDFDESFLSGLQHHGCEVVCVKRGYPWSGGVDLALGYGPFNPETGSVLLLGRQLQALPPAERPALAWWLTEGIPPMFLPGSLVGPLAKLRLAADTWLQRYGASWPARWRKRFLAGHRLRILGELAWAQQQGLLQVLAVTSTSRAQYYRHRGFQPVVAQLGYHPVYGQDLGLERDIDVLFLGNLNSSRRRKILPGLLDALERRKVRVVVADNLYGAERTRMLNRARVLLNVMRAPQDFVGQRFMLGAANKALNISESLNDHAPFIPGKYLIMAPLDQLADTIHFYLSHEAERRALAEATYAFVTGELSINRMVGRVLDRAREVKQKV